MIHQGPTHSPDAGRFLKVNHAGEHGAVNIYSGQMLVARFRAKILVPELAEFKAHEEKHRAIFGAELQRRGLSRCRSYWLCALGGYSLGVVSGLTGAQAIATTTVAVEKVVLRHLTHQLVILGEDDPDAVAAISAIVHEEQQHHDMSAARLKATGLVNTALGAIVSKVTESVIWIGMRV
jgi:ubiquinone biosynthesis monooxygenase Coq7